MFLRDQGSAAKEEAKRGNVLATRTAYLPSANNLALETKHPCECSGLSTSNKIIVLCSALTGIRY